MVYLLKMVIFHGELLNNQMVNPPFLGIPWSSQIIRTGRYSPEPMMKHHMEAELTILGGIYWGYLGITTNRTIFGRYHGKRTNKRIFFLRRINIISKNWVIYRTDLKRHCLAADENGQVDDGITMDFTNWRKNWANWLKTVSWTKRDSDTYE